MNRTPQATIGRSLAGKQTDAYATTGKRHADELPRCIHVAQFRSIQKYFRGYFLNKEDVSFRKYILDVSCGGATNFSTNDLPVLEELSFPELNKLEQDGLVEWNNKEIIVTSLGRHFIRNICRAFDLHLLRNQQNELHLFSKAI